MVLCEIFHFFRNYTFSISFSYSPTTRLNGQLPQQKRSVPFQGHFLYNRLTSRSYIFHILRNSTSGRYLS